MIAALFVDPCGFYAGRADVDAWDEKRDARLYAGSWPVVAHPPCQLWTNMAGVNFIRYKGAHNRPGNDRGCFASALSSVRRWGGVLEHPARSWAWPTFNLPPPVANGWMQAGSSEWTCEVWQSAYGHRARKATWLLYVGSHPPSDLIWDRAPGTHQVGWFDRKKKTLGKTESSATPQPFGEMLIEIARRSHG